MIIAEQALALWGLEGAKATLIAQRENAVYRVDHEDQRFALRLHRQGYRTDAQLSTELDWMAWLEHSGLIVPAPAQSRSGSNLQHVNGVQIHLLTWLEGSTLEATLPTLDPAKKRGVFYHLGQIMARLHEASDNWPDGGKCDRPAWNSQGLLGNTPLWDRFWENPALSDDQRTLFSDLRAKATTDLAVLLPNLDYGLIHADLVPGNVILNDDSLSIIDFDDGGYGFRLFELATALLKQCTNSDYDTLQDAMVDGYASLRSIDTRPLPLFLALRAATYVGWNMTRNVEDKTDARNARFIAQAEKLTKAYLDSRQD